LGVSMLAVPWPLRFTPTPWTVSPSQTIVARFHWSPVPVPSLQIAFQSAALNVRLI